MKLVIPKDKARLAELERRVSRVDLVSAPDGCGVVITVTVSGRSISRAFTSTTFSRALAAALAYTNDMGVKA